MKSKEEKSKTQQKMPKEQYLSSEKENSYFENGIFKRL